jgi:PIN domain nuclease of toxin-antitoxin system
MLRVGKQPLVGRSTGSPTLKEAARETICSHAVYNHEMYLSIVSVLEMCIVHSSGYESVEEK